MEREMSNVAIIALMVIAFWIGAITGYKHGSEK